MKRQKIKRYRFSVTQNTRRRRAARPLKAVGVVLVCLCLLTGAVFGIYKAIQSKTTGWHGEGLHRYYISPTTGTRAQGLYEINYKLYYFGSNNFLKVGWIEENGYVGYANADGELTQGEAKIDGKYYYFQPETGQLYTGWIMLDGVQYCFDETGHPRTGTYQEDGKVWELDSDGRVKNRLNGWKKTDGVLKYYDNSGAPAQGWTEIDGKDYFFVDGVSQAGWVETDAGTRYLDGNGNQMTEWCVIDGQPYAFGTNGEPKQGWDHSHEKSYYFINGVSQSGTFGEGALSNNLNGSGSVQPVGDQAPEDDLAEDAEGEPPEEELLEAQPTQTETTEAGQTAPAAQQPTQSPEESAAEQETTSKAPTAPETPAQEQQEEGIEDLADPCEDLAGAQRKQQRRNKERQREQQEIQLHIAVLRKDLFQPDGEGNGSAAGNSKEWTNGEVQRTGKEIGIGTVYLAAEGKQTITAGKPQSCNTQQRQSNTGNQQSQNGAPHIAAGKLTHCSGEDEVTCAKEQAKQHAGNIDVLFYG